MRPPVEVRTRCGDGEERDADGEDRVQAGADELRREPSEQRGDDGGGADQ